MRTEDNLDSGPSSSRQPSSLNKGFCPFWGVRGSERSASGFCSWWDVTAEPEYCPKGLVSAAHESKAGSSTLVVWWVHCGPAQRLWESQAWPFEVPVTSQIPRLPPLLTEEDRRAEQGECPMGKPETSLNLLCELEEYPQPQFPHLKPRQRDSTIPALAGLCLRHFSGEVDKPRDVPSLCAHTDPSSAAVTVRLPGKGVLLCCPNWPTWGCFSQHH